MSKSRPRRSLVRPRSLAFAHQGGRCIYCAVPMCAGDPRAYARKFGISEKQALQLRCTGEHLQPHSDGGTSAARNIAAACWHCNQFRHRRPAVPPPADFQHLVRMRMLKGRWHAAWVFERVLSRVGQYAFGELDLV
jgi:hypothetical protein